MADPDYQGFVTLANQAYTGQVDRARQQQLQDAKLAAQKAAGAQFAGGDYTGASGTLATSGDISGGIELNRFGQQQVQYGQEQHDRAATRAGVSSYAKGDLSGARDSFGDAGSLEGVQAIQARQADQFTKQHAYVQQATPVLAQAFAKGGPDALSHAIDQLGPDLTSPVLGMTPEQLSTWKQQAAANPQGFLDTLSAQAQKKYSLQKVGDDIVAVNEANPRDHYVVARGNIKLQPGETILAPDDNGGGSVGGGGPAPAQGASAAAPVARSPAPTGGAYDQAANIAVQHGATPAEQDYLRRTLRIESGGNPAAQNGSSTGLFQFHPATFQRALPGGDITSPEDQTRAALNLSRADAQTLQRIGVQPTPGNLYIMHQQGPGGGPALLTAPPEANAVAVLTPIYGSAAMARRAIVGNGGTPDMTAGQFVQRWQAKMGDGGAASSGQTTTQPVGIQAPPGYRVLAGGGQRYRPATAQELQGTGYSSGQVDSATGEIKHGIKPGEGDTVTDLPNITGPALLAQLPKGEANTAKALLEGRMAFPTGAGLRSPFWQRQLQIVSQVDPDFDAVNYNARAATRKDFTAGKAAATVASYNTAIGHLGSMIDAIPGLGNQNGMAGMLNPANQYLQTNVFHNKAISTFEADKTALSEELTSTFRNNGGSVHEVEDFKRQMDRSKSPDELYSTAKAFAELIGSRIQAYTDRYNTGMGTTADSPPGLNAHAKEVLNKILGGKPVFANNGGGNVPQLRSAPQGVKILSVTH